MKTIHITGYSVLYTFKGAKDSANPVGDLARADGQPEACG